jgi:tripartite-type tricarboxylate transporter receptor subunit TctC
VTVFSNYLETQMKLTLTPMMRLGLMAMLAIGSLTAQAQNYPTKTIRIVEPAGPGSAVDTAVRDILPTLNEGFGQQVFIDNKPGGNSLIGAREVVRAPADGYTIFHGNINNALNDLSTNVNNNCCRLGDTLIPVTRLFSTPLVLVINPNVKARTLKEFMALAKSQPDTLTYASGGGGSITQLLGELVKVKAGVSIQEVPYKAIGAELPDVMAGHVNAAYLAPVVVAQLIKSGKLIALGIASPKRLAILSDVPTFAEAGLPNVEAAGWNGIFLPAGTPAPIVNRVFTEFTKALSTPAAKAHGAEMGYEYSSESPEEFALFIKSEINKWGQVVKDAKIKLE